MRDVLVPEALPGLVSGFTHTLVAMIGASTMAGAIGSGDLAIRHGYQHFDTSSMLGVIIMLIVLVSLVQFGDDRLARVFDQR